MMIVRTGRNKRWRAAGGGRRTARTANSNDHGRGTNDHGQTADEQADERRGMNDEGRERNNKKMVNNEE